MNAGDPFAQLAPFIQAYIYQNGWADLRSIQKAAIPAILDTNDHVLIMSGTASGKTEAAMLPVLTLLEQSPAQSVGVLYIGPLKALINDQFERIEGLLFGRSDIPIQGWHGDIAYHQKKRFLKQPRGILQITPESMEAMFMNRAGELGIIFGDLRFIIIDEIHAFIGTERGQQVLCHLQRLERAIRRPIRRIGLSATIGDVNVALQWLQSSSQFQIHARLVTESTQGRRIELRVNHFVLAPEENAFHADIAPEEIGLRSRRTASLPISPGSLQEIPEEALSTEPSDVRWELQQNIKDYYDDLFTITMRYQKTLVFTNRRNKAERIAAELRHRLSQQRPGMDWYFVHHSSIAASLREVAEIRMREQAQQSSVIATASLELGIDIGHLDLTIQVNAPHSVSSFVQRLGRSGRRGAPSRMCLYTFEYLDNKADTSSEWEQIPWEFLQTIAIIQLYLEERWIEPPDIPTMPLSLLYQQTMSVMRARTELIPAQLAQSILKLAPFQAVTLDEYRLFLQHLLSLDQLARMDEGTLIVGMKGAQLTNHYHFYAIFANEQEFRVLAGAQEVGTIQSVPEVGGIIGLAGYAWRVISVDDRKRIVHVERAKGVVEQNWKTHGDLQFHKHVMLRLRRILQEEIMYSYLSPLAQQRLSLIRDFARRSDWLSSCVVSLEPGRFLLFPWTGWRIYKTLFFILMRMGWCSYSSDCDYYLEISHKGNIADVLAELRALSPRVPDLVNAMISNLKDMLLWRGKYDYLAPRVLLEKAYVNDVLDIPGTMQWLAACV
ncbi:DEAD/DEAH box helicase [Dictyobacter formicarum]|uniref:ATP-dependent helicase n=1 Tax=Dictyobacter formicarum TaxID=2778368 RepID=A0ABQ3VAL1_9CHLR|nr:DEAD/DEAH box helicase [Dictyobacter formicarum]GHO82261.1 ATP-dependent helicase [Dictyobacter formicarum]